MELKASIVCPPKEIAGKSGKKCNCHLCGQDIFIVDGILERLNQHAETNLTEKDVTYICMDCGLKFMSEGAKSEIIGSSKEESREALSQLSDLLGANNKSFKDKHNG